MKIKKLTHHFWNSTWFCQNRFCPGGKIAIPNNIRPVIRGELKFCPICARGLDKPAQTVKMK